MKIDGVVSNLEITSGHEDVVSETGQSALGVAALAGAATGVEIDMQFFSCDVGQIPVVGKFHSVGFKDGDQMEFVVSEHDGIVVSHAARCAHPRILWMLPYHVRGHKAQNRHDLKMNLLTSAALTIAGTIFLHFEAPFRDFSSMALITIANFLLSLLVLWWVRSHFWGIAEVTTSILQVLGYKNPEMADLSIDDRKARKATGQKWSLPNWTFRY